TAERERRSGWLARKRRLARRRRPARNPRPRSPPPRRRRCARASPCPTVPEVEPRRAGGTGTLVTTRSSPSPDAGPGRLSPLAPSRGAVMLLMIGEVLRFCAVASARPGSAFWGFLCHHQEHVDWVGGSLHDLIQPSFSFLVGVALPFSL